MEREKRRLVLVHGTYHGAWCWYKVAALLKSRGYQVTALDMAASGIHPKQMEEIRSITQYFEPLMEFLRGLAPEERVILVGHSFGGVCISVAMENFPHKIAAAVFVTGWMPGPDLSYSSLQLEFKKSISESNLGSTSNITIDESINNYRNGSRTFEPQVLASKSYHLSPLEDVTLAMSLLRPFSNFGDEDLQENTRLTREKYGVVAKVYIVCEQDKIFKHEFQVSMVERNPPNDVKVIAAADHMPMFSKPQELSTYLQEIANTYY